MSVSVHCCRALRAIPHESFRGPYPGPLNNYFNTIICAFVSVHRCRPSAWVATPTQGVALNLWQKSGTQCGAYGWWLEVLKHNNDKQHVGQPVANIKVIWKSSPFCKTTPVNVWLYSSSWQADFDSVLCHHTAHQSWDHVLEGSAQLPLGDTRSGIKDQEQFLQRLDNLDNEGTRRYLPKKSGHMQNKGETNQDDGRETLTLCSERFVVPGAQNIIRVLRAPNFVWSARSTGLCKSAWGTMVLKCHLSSVGSHKVRSFHFFHSSVPLPHSKSELGHHNFF